MILQTNYLNDRQRRLSEQSTLDPASRVKAVATPLRHNNDASGRNLNPLSEERAETQAQLYCSRTDGQ